jgi:2-C-methyl-D-erythritol 2,4-cyclodiphosphate synthase
MNKDVFPFRVGLGHDIHQLVEDRELWLGGVKIDYPLGLLGHSDADALIHAIMDALLGALALGDIGEHFPDTDLKFKGVNSLILLQKVVSKVKEQGYKIANIDCNIHCEKPKLLPYKKQMIAIIAKTLKVGEGQVSIKAGTNEKQDAVGQGRAIVCQAIALLYKDINASAAVGL